MLHSKDQKVRSLLLHGNMGLEKESLRVREDGYLAHTPHPFGESTHIVRDFCENQTEINTGIHPNAKGAIQELGHYTEVIQKTLKELPERELLWPFSNPPYIRNEEDIPIAQFGGVQSNKTVYRNYLSDRYGRYIMTLSGIHFNYSFADDLLLEDFALSGETDYKEYKNRLYLDLGQKAAQYGWIITAVTAASPIVDSSFLEKGKTGESCFLGKASVRCSESGYWNSFVPILNYTSIEAYTDSIQYYVDHHFLAAPSELYYPVRLKPKGLNNLTTLREKGINHIELRNVDLNPLVPEGLDIRDARFIQYLLIWLASIPSKPFPDSGQALAVQNFKKAASYDLKTVKIVTASGKTASVADAAVEIIDAMQDFYQDFPEEVSKVLAYQKNKFVDPEARYAWIVRKKFGTDYVRRGLALAKKRQEN